MQSNKKLNEDNDKNLNQQLANVREKYKEKYYREKNKNDNELMLPLELWSEIFSYLDNESLKNMYVVCKAFYFFLSENKKFKNRVRNPMLNYTSLAGNAVSKEITPMHGDISYGFLSLTHNTFAVICHHEILIINEKGETLKTLNGHNEQITEMIKIPSIANLIATASYAEGSIRVWDIEKGKDLYTISHPRVHSLAVTKNGHLLSADSNQLNIWDIKNGDFIHSFNLTPNLCQMLVSQDNKIITNQWKQSNDGATHYTIKIWDMEGNLIHTLDDNMSRIQCHLLNDDKLVAISYGAIRTWDLKNNYQFKKVKNNKIKDNFESIPLQNEILAIVTRHSYTQRMFTTKRWWEELMIVSCDSNNNLYHVCFPLNTHPIIFARTFNGNIKYIDDQKRLHSMTFQVAENQPDAALPRRSPK